MPSQFSTSEQMISSCGTRLMSVMSVGFKQASGSMAADVSR